MRSPMYPSQDTERGFTLLDTLIALTIVGSLSAIAVPSAVA